MSDNNECLITPSCRLTGIITGAIKAFFNHLDQYSLQDLLDKPTYDILYTPRIPINEIAERPTKSSGRLKTIQPY